MTPSPSIHYKRRWFYVLWCTLLLASLAALGLWETPARSGSADLAFKIQVANVPPGCAVQFWAGPKKAWPGADHRAPMNQPGLPLTAAGEAIGHLNLRVAYRRWIGGVIARRTDDLLVLKFQPRSGTPRYFTIPLDMDWHSQILRPGRRMAFSTSIDWGNLWLDPLAVPTSSR